MLDKVQIADPESVMRRYPHQLSGGMQQRVVIAMALANDPTLLILDEPTTGLDATVEAEVLDLVAALRSEFGTSILFISHNLGVIARCATASACSTPGGSSRRARPSRCFDDPRHPYTVGLLRCIPRGGVRKDEGRLDTIPGFLPQLGAELPGCVFVDRCALAQEICRRGAAAPRPRRPTAAAATSTSRRRSCRARRRPGWRSRASSIDRRRRSFASRSLAKTFRQEGHDVHALADVSARSGPGETLGLVGESGSGKTTLARTLLGIDRARRGLVVELDGRQLPGPLGKRDRDDVRALQIVFQNPDSALNRRFSVRQLLGRALQEARRASRARQPRRACSSWPSRCGSTSAT